MYDLKKVKLPKKAHIAEVCDLAKPFGLTVDLEYVPIAAVNNLAGAVKVLRTINQALEAAFAKDKK